MKRFSPIMRVIAISTLLLVGIGMAIYLDTRLQPVTEDSSLIEIKNIKTLSTRFNQDAGKTRLILLLSPT
jgi:hypothetical protein